MSTTFYYTGRKRLRTKEGLLREPLLVLQVEIREKGTYKDRHGFTQDVDRTFWRDARVQDMTIDGKDVVEGA